MFSLVAAVAVGCGPRCEAEIIDDRGAQAAVLDRARESIDVFFDLLDPQYSLCVNRVRFLPDHPEREGRYNQASNTVRVESETTGLPLDIILWHELGHALYEQNKLDLDPKQYEPTAFVADYATEKRRVNEGFARVVEYGPVFAQLVQERCPTDSPGAATLREVGQMFVGADERHIASDYALVPRGVFPDIPHGDAYAIDEHTVMVRVDQGSRVYYVDVSALTAVEYGALWDVSDGLQPATSLLPTWDGDVTVENSVLFYPFTINTLDSSTGVVRWIRYKGNRFQAFGCVDAQDVVVELGGEVWMLRWAEDGLQLLRFEPTE